MKIRLIKIILTIIILLLNAYVVNAQLWKELSEVIKIYGYDFTIGYKQVGYSEKKYFRYEKVIPKEVDWKFNEGFTRFYTMKTKDGSDEFCSEIDIFLPSSYINLVVSYFKNKLYVQEAYMIWKNYETQVVYEVNVKDGYCIINISYHY